MFSPCRTWRYVLTRRWGEGPALAVIGLNPSTADEQTDDPTIRRCVGLARRWSYGALVMLNLFAYRATDPADMQRAPNPIGPDNDRHIAEQTRAAGMVLAAWGVHGEWGQRAVHVQVMLGATYGVPLHALGWTRAGHPRHPLYVRGDTEPESFPS